jgi:hypothetical protein
MDVSSCVQNLGLRLQWQHHVPGVQTERRGLAGPVRDLLGGETSPAAFFVEGRAETFRAALTAQESCPVQS